MKINQQQIQMVKQLSSKYKQTKPIKRSDLRNVYQQIITTYDKQTSKMKAQQRKLKKHFADDILFRANHTLPKLDLDLKHPQTNKYYSKKLLVNDSVFLCQKKQIRQEMLLKQYKSSQLYPKSDEKNLRFQRINIPDVLTARDKTILTERNRKILELYQKAQNQRIVQSPIKISFIRKMRESHQQLQLDNHQGVDYQRQSQILPEQSFDLGATDKRMLTILKQAKEKRHKFQLPKMKQNRSKNSSEVLKVDGNISYRSINGNHHNSATQQDSPQKLSKQEKQQIEKPSKQRMKNRSLMKLGGTGNISPMKIKRKKFNWRNQNLNLLPINKDQLYALLRGYVGINSIQEINSGFYRAYVGFGNNHQIIKKTLKERTHWTIVDSLDDDPHFVWTQFKLMKFSDSLPTRPTSSLFKGQLSHINIEQLENDLQLEQFIKLKSNEFILGCQKILEHKIFLKLMKAIKDRFLNSGNIQQYRKLKYYALEYFPATKMSILEKQRKSSQTRMHNHIDGAGSIGDKKGLFLYLKKYTELFEEEINTLVPDTIHIDSDDYGHQAIFTEIPEGPWILKPGEQTNRGQGISIHLTKQSLIMQLSKKKTHSRKPDRKYTSIIQKYIMPLLYFNRKFDIRIWILWNASSKQAWWYQQGYIRTSSKQFSLKNTSKFIHLTNDAIQSTGDEYGKYQPANKLSFNEFNKYLEIQFGYKGFYDSILMEMKSMAIKVFRMGNLLFDPLQKQHTFQLFGFDYLIDNKFKPWLIQCNTNPCLQINCSLLTRLVPNMLDNLMSLTVDTLFPIPTKRKLKDPQPWHHESFKFELLYDGNQDLQTKQKILTHSGFNISYGGQYQQSQES